MKFAQKPLSAIFTMSGLASVILWVIFVRTERGDYVVKESRTGN